LKDSSLDKRSSFLRHWSALLPRLEAELSDPAHPVRHAFDDYLPARRSTGGVLDGQQLAALVGLSLFVPHAPRSVADSIGEVRALQSTVDVSAVLDQIAAARHTDDPAAHLLEMLLAESPSDTRRKRGIYFTPQPLVRFIVRSVDAVLRHEFDDPGGLKNPSLPLRIVDPACGSGVFLIELGRRPEETCDHLTGIDVVPACCVAVRMILAERAPEVVCANVLHDVRLGERLFPKRGAIPVIVGNPPYSNFGKQNRGPWIRRQLAAYKLGLRERKVNLDDDFIKFLRWGQYWIDRAGRGVLAMVTSSTYLRGLTHRQMRASLLGSFDRAYFVDLQGDRKRARGDPTTDTDENIFGIQQGVAVCVLAKTGRRSPQRTAVAQLTGTRTDKLRALDRADATSLAQVTIEPAAPHYLFAVPQRSRNQQQYLSWPSLNEIFRKYSSGVQSKRDRLFVGFTAGEVAGKMRAFLRHARRGQFAPDIPPWLRQKSAHVDFDPSMIRPYMVAPMDVRWIYYDPRLLGRARYPVMRHLQPGNRGLIFMRQSTNRGGYDHFLATSVLMSDRVFYSAHGAPFFAPLMLSADGAGKANFSRTWTATFRERVGGGGRDPLCPQDLFHWIYAVVHSATYRARFASLLSVDFARIPWPASDREFSEAAQLGRELAERHMAACLPPETTGHRTSTFRPDEIPDLVRQHQIGGYPVLTRWLKQRRGKGLDPGELDHARHLSNTIRQTLAITARIDQTIAASW
jgi:predicted helicase